MTLKDVETFHRKKKDIPRIVRKTIGNKEIIYGERALNARFPTFLDRPTQDFDVFSQTPRKDAKQTEKALDKHFGGDYFRTKKAIYPRTIRVVSNINQETYADYTKPKQRIPSEKIKGKRYVKLSYVKKTIKKTLKDPKAKFRHAKDRDALNRIKIYEKKKIKTKPKRKQTLKGFRWG